MQQKNFVGVLKDEQIKRVVEIPKKIVELGLLKGIGGEVSRIAIS